MRFLVLLLILLLPGLASAQDAKPKPVETIPPGEDKITPIRKGQLAPYDGQLFDIDTAIRWGFWLQQYKYRLEADALYYQQVCRVETDFQGRKFRIEEERNRKIEEDLNKRLLRSEEARLVAEEEVRNPAWYRTPEFGGVVGVVMTVGVVALAIWAVDAGTGN